MTKCECNEKIGTEINSYQLFEEIKKFFEEQVEDGIIIEVEVESPYYVWIDRLSSERANWYANKWYKCKYCGTLWEFTYPDFPACGFVRKFEDGIYKKEKIIENRNDIVY